MRRLWLQCPYSVGPRHVSATLVQPTPRGVTLRGQRALKGHHVQSLSPYRCAWLSSRGDLNGLSGTTDGPMQPNTFDLAHVGTSVDKLMGISVQRNKTGSCG